jgi:hypothetical protein
MDILNLLRFDYMVPKRTNLEPPAGDGQPMPAGNFLDELRFEKRHLSAELPIELGEGLK